MEHILLNNTSHENDMYSCEKVCLWLNVLLAVGFLGKDIIYKQLDGATYELEGEHDYIFIKFKPNNSEKYPYNVRVPVEIYAKQSNINIVNMLLHIIDGYVSILEIYNMDGTDFTGEFSLDDIEYRVNEDVQPKNSA